MMRGQRPENRDRRFKLRLAGLLGFVALLILVVCLARTTPAGLDNGFGSGTSPAAKPSAVDHSAALTWTGTTGPYRVYRGATANAPGELVATTPNAFYAPPAPSVPGYYRVIDGGGTPVPGVIVITDPGAPAPIESGDGIVYIGDGSRDQANRWGNGSEIDRWSKDPQYQAMIGAWNRPLSETERRILSSTASAEDNARMLAGANTPYTQAELDRWNAQYATTEPFGGATSQIQTGILGSGGAQ
jgi:hypothetical protein